MFPRSESALTERAVGGMVGASQTLTDRLRQQRDTLQLRLKELSEALEAIESNPEIQRVVDSLHKLNI